MAKRSLEESNEESAGGEKNLANQVSHLKGISLIPIQLDTPSPKKVNNGKGKDDSSFDFSIVALNISKTKDDETKEATEKSEATPVDEKSPEKIKVLDYSDSIYDAESKKYLTQSDVEKKLIEYGENLTELKLGFFFDSRIMITIRNHCPNIENLELELKRYTETHLNNAFLHMANLKKIVIKNLDQYLLNKTAESLPETIEKIIFSSPNIYNYEPPNLLPAFEKFNSLHSLALADYNLADRSITTMLRKKTGLVELSLAGSKVMSGVGIINNLTNLEVLNFDNTVSKVNDGFGVLKKLGESMKKLRWLGISFYSGVNDHGLAFLSKLKNIEWLVIEGMDRYYQRNFDDVISSFHGLKKLYCANNDNVSDYSVKLILKNSPNLEYLDVFNTRITEKTLEHAAEFASVRKGDTELTLVINGSEVCFYEDYRDCPGLKIIVKYTKPYGEI